MRRIDARQDLHLLQINILLAHLDEQVAGPAANRNLPRLISDIGKVQCLQRFWRPEVEFAVDVSRPADVAVADDDIDEGQRFPGP